MSRGDIAACDGASLRDVDGRTAADLAAGRGYGEVVQVIEAALAERS